MDGCLACDLARGKLPLPGGRIHETTHWLVEHSVAPLDAGTLVVKPKRHVLRVGALKPEEAQELGGVLHRACAAIDAVAAPDQVYVTLWSYSGGEPVHLHWLLQPVSAETVAAHEGLLGPHLQAAMLDAGGRPDEDEVAAVAQQLRAWFRFAAARAE